MKLSYIAIRVKNMDESLKFYTENLGFKFIEERSYMPGERVASLIDEKSGQRLNMMYYAEDCKLYTPWKEDGVELDHLSFEVDDAKKTFDELVKNGAPVNTVLMERKTDDGIFKMGFIKDPNGIWIGFRSQQKS
ncbi:MAG: VOC family protein [Patescibacteria group bacterium]|nr:VOC family protein [Patescibacteria group bacterium]